MSARRILQLLRLRVALNALGATHYTAAHSPWDRKRIRVHNRINARLSKETARV